MQKERSEEEVWIYISKMNWRETGMASSSMYSINDTIQWSSVQGIPLSGL